MSGNSNHGNNPPAQSNINSSSKHGSKASVGMSSSNAMGKASSSNLGAAKAQSSGVGSINGPQQVYSNHGP